MVYILLIDVSKGNKNITNENANLWEEILRINTKINQIVLISNYGIDSYFEMYPAHSKTVTTIEFTFNDHWKNDRVYGHHFFNDDKLSLKKWCNDHWINDRGEAPYSI